MEQKSNCATRYPILLVHGIGFRDSRVFNYWGRIPKALEQKGVMIFYGNQDSHGSVEDNARALQVRVREILAQTGAEKVNIIAHSKGGLDVRWMISCMGESSHVASLTTISTPHWGSRTVDLLLRLPDILVRMLSMCCDLWYRMLGDRHPNAYEVFHQLTTKRAVQFNAAVPDADGVYYQSYAFVMRRATGDMLMWLPYLVVKAVEGQSDGLVTPESAKWGNFRGVWTGRGRRGVSHCDEVDLRRRPLSRETHAVSNKIWDITAFYCDLVAELKQFGL